MTTLRSLLSCSALLVGVLVPATAAQVPGVSREQMWPAPTEADWAKPCLIKWQRTYEDAVAVSLETKMPILVCVNMDGEIASEHYAGIRYRQPEIAVLYEPYVCVIASVYRHNPHDYDHEGKRILCPRFGSVTCGEHIALEPGLFDKFMDGKRIAPRHIGVELDSQEMYDVYYAFDTDSIFNALREGIAAREEQPPEPPRGDRPLLELVASRDMEDRALVEQAYITGDFAVRRTLLEAAVTNAEVAQTDLLRLALFGEDRELKQLAWRALTASTSVDSIDLILEALRFPMEAEERDALVATLDRIGEASMRAHMLAIIHRGLAQQSEVVDLEAWLAVIGSGPPPSPDLDELRTRLEEAADASAASPADAVLRLELADLFMELAYHPGTELQYSELMLVDALRIAREAEELGASGWRLNSVIAIAANELGDYGEARTRVEAALAGMPHDTQGWRATRVLALYGRLRQGGIMRALRAERDWPGSWLADLHASYTVLSRHPLGTDRQVVGHYDFLRALGAYGQAARVLEVSLERFPDSWVLHDRLRSRLLRERRLDGLDGLEATYEALLREEGASPNLEWFAGYASLVAAEFHRRAGEAEGARAAYTRSIAHYERAIERNPSTQDSSDHYVALALAGRARLAYESGELEAALSELLASFARRPDAAGSLDGLGLSPVATARMLRARLAEAGQEELVAGLDEALATLPPDMLLPPAFEAVGPSRPSGEGQGPPRRRRPRRDR